MSASEARAKLQALATPEARSAAMGFFKTGPGQYGEGDQFLGVRVPDTRKVAREFRSLPMPEVQRLLKSAIHEERLLALLILVATVQECDDQKRREVYDFYVANIEFVNNWDLVDTSAPAIVGGYLFQRSRRPLLKLVESHSLWERRIAILATLYFIKRNDFQDTLSLSRTLLADKEDLLHKATGWMLREVGQRDEALLRQFLDQHARQMPRTMLRYAIEKFSPSVRKKYMSR